MLTKFELFSYQYKSDEELFEYFDQLQPIEKVQLRGYWKGIEIESKHPLNNTLTYCDWYGKRFLPNGDVDALIFRENETSSTCFKIDPKNFPLGLLLPKINLVKYIFKTISPIFETYKPCAKLQNINYRGKTSAALLYNDVDVIDYYRRIDSDTVFAIVESPIYKRPFFYILQRDEPTNIKFRRKSQRIEQSRLTKLGE